MHQAMLRAAAAAQQRAPPADGNAPVDDAAPRGLQPGVRAGGPAAQGIERLADDFGAPVSDAGELAWKSVFRGHAICYFHCHAVFQRFSSAP